MRSEACEEVDGTSYVVRNLQFRTLRFYWHSEKWRKDYKKCIALVMNRWGRAGAWKEKI
jgi:protoporphyrinogen oxidase